MAAKTLRLAAIQLILALSLFLALADAQEPSSDTYRTNKGPLTTKFEGPSTCLSESLDAKAPAATNADYGVGPDISAQAFVHPVTRRAHYRHPGKDRKPLISAAQITTTATIDGTTTTQTLRAVYATNIQIRYQASDSSVVPVPTENNLPPIDDGSLTAGQKGGIAVGVILGVLALGGAGYYLGRRHKQLRAYNDINLQHTPANPPPAYPGKK